MSKTTNLNRETHHGHFVSSRKETPRDERQFHILQRKAYNKSGTRKRLPKTTARTRIRTSRENSTVKKIHNCKRYPLQAHVRDVLYISSCEARTESACSDKCFERKSAQAVVTKGPHDELSDVVSTGVNVKMSRKNENFKSTSSLPYQHMDNNRVLVSFLDLKRGNPNARRLFKRKNVGTDCRRPTLDQFAMTDHRLTCKPFAREDCQQQPVVGQVSRLTCPNISHTGRLESNVRFLIGSKETNSVWNQTFSEEHYAKISKSFPINRICDIQLSHLQRLLSVHCDCGSIFTKNVNHILDSRNLYQLQKLSKLDCVRYEADCSVASPDDVYENVTELDQTVRTNSELIFQKVIDDAESALTTPENVQVKKREASMTLKNESKESTDADTQIEARKQKVVKDLHEKDRSQMTKSQKEPPPIMPKPNMSTLKLFIDRARNIKCETGCVQDHMFDGSLRYKRNCDTAQEEESPEKTKDCRRFKPDGTEWTDGHGCSKLQKSFQRRIGVSNPVLLPCNNTNQAIVSNDGADYSVSGIEVLAGDYTSTVEEPGYDHSDYSSGQKLSTSTDFRVRVKTPAKKHTSNVTIEVVDAALNNKSKDVNLRNTSKEDHKQQGHRPVCVQEIAKKLENFFRKRSISCRPLVEPMEFQDKSTSDDYVDSSLSQIRTNHTQGYFRPLPYLDEIRKYSFERMVKSSKEVANALSKGDGKKACVNGHTFNQHKETEKCHSFDSRKSPCPNQVNVCAVPDTLDKKSRKNTVAAKQLINIQPSDILCGATPSSSASAVPTAGTSPQKETHEERITPKHLSVVAELKLRIQNWRKDSSTMADDLCDTLKPSYISDTSSGRVGTNSVLRHLYRGKSESTHQEKLMPLLMVSECFPVSLTRLQKWVSVQNSKQEPVQKPPGSPLDFEYILPSISTSSLALIVSNNALSGGDNSRYPGENVQIVQTEEPEQPQDAVLGIHLKHGKSNKSEPDINLASNLRQGSSGQRISTNVMKEMGEKSSASKINEEVCGDQSVQEENESTKRRQRIKQPHVDQLSNSKFIFPGIITSTWHPRNTGIESSVSYTDNVASVIFDSCKTNSTKQQRVEAACDCQPFNDNKQKKYKSSSDSLIIHNNHSKEAHSGEKPRSSSVGVDKDKFSTDEKKISCTEAEIIHSTRTCSTVPSFTSCLPSSSYFSAVSLTNKSVSTLQTKLQHEPLDSLTSSSSNLSIMSGSFHTPRASSKDSFAYGSKASISIPNQKEREVLKAGSEVNKDPGVENSMKTKQVHSKTESYGLHYKTKECNGEDQVYKPQTFNDTQVSEGYDQHHICKEVTNDIKTDKRSEMPCSCDISNSLTNYNNIFKQGANRADSCALPKIHPQQTLDPLVGNKWQERNNSENSVRQWILSTAPLQTMPVSDPLIKHTKLRTLTSSDQFIKETTQHKEQSSKLINFASNLEKTSCTGSNCAARSMKETTSKSDKDKGKSVAVDTLKDMNSCESIAEVHQTDEHTLVAWGSPNNDLTEQVSHAQSTRNLSQTKQKNTHSCLVNSNAANSGGIDVLLRPDVQSSESDCYWSCVSSDTGSSFPPVLSTSESGTFCTARSREDFFVVDTFLPLSRFDQKRRRYTNLRKRAFDMKGIHRPKKRKTKDQGLENRVLSNIRLDNRKSRRKRVRMRPRHSTTPLVSSKHVMLQLAQTYKILGRFLQDVLKHHNLKSPEFLNMLRYSPESNGHDESKLYSSSSDTLSDSSTTWHAKIQVAQPNSKSNRAWCIEDTLPGITKRVPYNSKWVTQKCPSISRLLHTPHTSETSIWKASQFKVSSETGLITTATATQTRVKSPTSSSVRVHQTSSPILHQRNSPILHQRRSSILHKGKQLSETTVGQEPQFKDFSQTGSAITVEATQTRLESPTYNSRPFILYQSEQLPEISIGNESQFNVFLETGPAITFSGTHIRVESPTYNSGRIHQESPSILHQRKESLETRFGNESQIEVLETRPATTFSTTQTGVESPTYNSRRVYQKDPSILHHRKRLSETNIGHDSHFNVSLKTGPTTTISDTLTRVESPKKFETISATYILGRNTPGGDQEETKETPFSEETAPATLSVVTVSQNGLYTSNVPLPLHATMEGKMYYHPMLPQDERVRLEMPPYQSILDSALDASTKESVIPILHQGNTVSCAVKEEKESVSLLCEEKETLCDFRVQRTNDTFENLSEVCAPASDEIKDRVYLYRTSANSPETEMHKDRHVTLNEPMQYGMNDHQDIINVITNDYSSVLIPGSIVATDQVNVVLDTRSDITEGTEKYCNKGSTEIQPSPSDEEVALIMCETQSPVGTHSITSKSPRRKIVVPDDVSRRNIATKGSSTPYPLLPEEMLEQETLTSDLSLYFSPEHELEAVTTILEDTFMTGTEDQESNALLSEIELLLSPIYEECCLLPACGELKDFNCHSKELLKENWTLCRQNQSHQTYTKPSYTVHEESMIEDILRSEVDGDDINGNNDNKLCVLICLLKNLSMCVKKLLGKYKHEDKMLNEGKKAINFISNTSNAENTSMLPGTYSKYHVKNNTTLEMKKQDFKSHSPGIFIKNMASKLGVDFKMILQKALQVARTLKLQLDTRSIRSSSAESVTFKKSPEVDHFHNMVLSKRSKTENENLGELDVGENDLMSSSKMKRISDSQKNNCNTQALIETYVLPDSTQISAFDVADSQTAESFSKRKPNPNMTLRHTNNESMGKERPDKNEILGKIEILCRYLQISKYHLERISSDQMSTSVSGNNTSSFTCVSRIRESCSDVGNTDQPCVAPRQRDLVINCDEKNSSIDLTMSNQSKNNEVSNSEILPLICDENVTVEATHRFHNSQAQDFNTGMVLRDGSKLQCGEPATRSVCNNLSITKRFPNKVERYKTSRKTSPVGISLYTIREHPEWKEFASTNSAFLKREKSYHDLKKCKGATSSDSTTKEANLTLRKETTRTIQGHDKSSSHKRADDKTLAVPEYRSFEVSVANKNHHISVPRTDSIVYTLGPSADANVQYYVQPSAESYLKGNVLYDKQVGNANQGRSRTVYTSSKVKNIDQTYIDSICADNTLEAYPSYSNSLNMANGQLSERRSIEREYNSSSMTANSGKGYTLHKIGNKSVWTRHPFEAGHFSPNNMSEVKSVRDVHSSAQCSTQNICQRFTERQNSSVSNDSCRWCHTINNPNKSFSSNDKTINVGISQEGKSKLPLWPPNQDVSPLDEANAVFVSMCVVSETTDPITGQPLLSVTDTVSKTHGNEHTVRYNQKGSCDHSHLNSDTLASINAAAAKRHTMSVLPDMPSASVGSSDSFHSISNGSEDEDILEDGLLGGQQSYWYNNTCETKNHLMRFSQMSTNQNAADSPPQSSETWQVSENQPVFSNFTQGYNRRSAIPLKAPQMHGQALGTLKCCRSISEPSVSFSVSSTGSSCGSREKLSVSDKINFFTRKINNLTRTVKSKKQSCVETHKSTPIRIMLEKYQSASKVSKEIKVPMQDINHFDNTQTGLNKPASHTNDLSNAYRVTTDKPQRGKTSSCRLKSKEPAYVVISDIDKQNFEPQTAISESLKKHGVKSSTSESSCCSTGQLHKVKSRKQLIHQHPMLMPQLASKTYISHADEQDCSAVAKEMTRRNVTEKINIKAVKSDETLRIPSSSTKNISGYHSTAKLNRHAINYRVGIRKAFSELSLKDKATTHKIKLNPNPKKTDTETPRKMETLTKSRELFNLSTNYDHANLVKRNPVNIYKMHCTKPKAFTASKFPGTTVSKRLIPCVNKPQQPSRNPIHQRERTHKTVTSKQTELPMKKQNIPAHKRKNCINEPSLPRTSLTDSLHSICNPERQSKGREGTIKESTQNGSFVTESFSALSQGEPEAISSRSFEIIENSSTQSTIQKEVCDREEHDSDKSDYFMAPDFKLIANRSPDSVPSTGKSTTSNDSYTTASQTVHRTTQQYAHNEKNQHEIQNTRKNNRLFSGKGHQSEKEVKSTQTTRETEPVPETASCTAALRDRSSHSVRSQRGAKDSLYQKSPMFNFKQQSTWPCANNEVNCVADQHYRTDSYHTSAYYQFYNHFPCQRLKQIRTLSNKHGTQSGRRLCKWSEQLKCRPLSERLQQTVMQSSRHATKEKSDYTTSNEVNLSNSMIAVSKSPFVNLPKYVNKLARLFKEPISNLNVFTKNALISKRRSPQYENQQVKKSFLKQKENFCSSQNNHCLGDSTGRYSKQSKLSNEKNREKRTQVQRGVSLQEFYSPVTFHCEETSNHTVPKIARIPSSKEKMYNRSRCNIRIRTQFAHLKSQTVACESETSKLSNTTERTCHRRSRGIPAAFHRKNGGSKNIGQISSSKTPWRCASETKYHDANIGSSQTYTIGRSLIGAEANLSKNASDDGICQQLKHADEHYDTTLEHVERCPSHIFRSRRILYKSKSDKEISKYLNKDKMEDHVSNDALAKKQPLVGGRCQRKIMTKQLSDKSPTMGVFRSPSHGLPSTVAKSSSSSDSYVTSKTDDPGNRKCIIPRSAVCNGRSEEIRNTAPKNHVCSNRKSSENCTMMCLSESDIWINRFSCRTRESASDLKQCSSQVSARESALLSSSDDGFISRVRVKRACLNIHKAFRHYDAAESQYDVEAHLKNSLQQIDNDEIMLNENEELKRNITNVISKEIPKKDVHHNADKTVGNTNETQESDASADSQQNLKQNPTKVLNHESYGNAVGIKSSLERNSLSTEQLQSMVQIHKHTQGSGITYKRRECHLEKKSNKLKQKPTNEMKMDRTRPTEYKVGDCSENMKEESSGRILQKPEGPKYKSERTKWKIKTGSIQHTCNCKDRSRKCFHSPIAKIEILKPNPGMEIVTRVRRSPKVCRKECFHSPNVHGVDFATPYGQSATVHRRMPVTANDQEGLLPKESTRMKKRVSRNSTYATKNAFTTKKFDHFDLLTSKKSPVAHIHTRSVNLSLPGIVSHQQVQKFNMTNKAKCPIHHYDPNTMPRRIHKSRKQCNINFNSPNKSKISDDRSKSVQMAKTCEKNPQNKRKLLREKANMELMKLSRTDPFYRRSDDKYNSKLKKELAFTNMPTSTQILKYCTPDRDIKRSASTFFEARNDRKQPLHKNKSSNSAKMLRTRHHFANHGLTQLADSHKRCSKQFLLNSKTQSAISRKNIRSSPYTSDEQPSLFSLSEKTNSEDSTIYKDPQSGKHLSALSPQARSFCARFHSPISLASPETHPDFHVLFPDRERMIQSRFVQKMPNQQGYNDMATASNDTSRINNEKNVIHGTSIGRNRCAHLEERNISSSSFSHLTPANPFSKAHSLSQLKTHARRSVAHLKQPQRRCKDTSNALEFSSPYHRGSSKDWNSCPYPWTSHGNSKSNAASLCPINRWESVPVHAAYRSVCNRTNNTNRKPKSGRPTDSQSQYENKANCRQMNKVWCENTDNNSNKNTASFRIIAKSAGDKNATPAFTIEVSPTNQDNSDEAVPKFEDRREPHPSANFMTTEFKRSKKASKNALRHSFPHCVYKSSKTGVCDNRVTPRTIKLSYDKGFSESTSSDSIQSSAVHQISTAEETRLENSSPSPSEETTQFTIQTKSPPKISNDSSPRVYQVTATIKGKGRSTPSCVEKCVTRTVCHGTSYEPEGENSYISSVSAARCVSRKVKSPIPSSKFCVLSRDTPDILLYKTSEYKTPSVSTLVTTVSSPKPYSPAKKHSLSSTDSAVTHAVPLCSLCPHCTEAKFTSHGRPPKYRHICRSFTRENVSSDTAMDLMADALTKLKQNPQTVKHKSHRGIQNFRLAQRSGCSVVSAVPSYHSVQSDHQLTTTRSFSFKRNTNIKRLSSVKTETTRRLRQARRTLKTQETLLGLVSKAHAMLRNAVVATRREIVERKNRARQKQLQIAMKIASYKRLLKDHSFLSASSSASVEQLSVSDTCFETVSDSVEFDGLQSAMNGSHSHVDLIAVHETSSNDSFGELYVRQQQNCTPCCLPQSDSFLASSTVVSQPIIDKLCSRCLRREATSNDTKPRVSWRRKEYPKCSTQMYKLNCANHCRCSRLSVNTPSVTIECPMNGSYLQRFSSSEDSISYPPFTISVEENLKFQSGKNKTPFKRKPCPIDRGAKLLCHSDHRWGPCTMHYLCSKELNCNESKKTTGPNETTHFHSISFRRIHEEYFDHLRQLAKQIASEAVKDVSRYSVGRGKPHRPVRPGESLCEMRYLLTLKDVSRMVAAVCMAAMNQSITSHWKSFCSIFLQQRRQISLTAVHVCSDSSDMSSIVSFSDDDSPVRPSPGFLRSALTSVKRVRLSESSHGQTKQLKTHSTMCKENCAGNMASQRVSRQYSDVCAEHCGAQAKSAALRRAGYSAKRTLKRHQPPRCQYQDNCDSSESDVSSVTVEVNSIEGGSEQEIRHQKKCVAFKNRRPMTGRSELTNYVSCCSFPRIPSTAFLTNTDQNVVQGRSLSRSIIKNCVEHSNGRNDQIPRSCHISNRVSVPYKYKPRNGGTHKLYTPYIKPCRSEDCRQVWSHLNQSHPDNMYLVEHYQESSEEVSSSLSSGSVKSRKERRASKIFISTLPEESQQTLRCLQNWRSKQCNRYSDQRRRINVAQHSNDRSEYQQCGTLSTSRVYSCKSCSEMDFHKLRKDNEEIQPHGRTFHDYPDTCKTVGFDSDHGVRRVNQNINISITPNRYRYRSSKSGCSAHESDDSGRSRIHVDIEHKCRTDPRLTQTSYTCRKSGNFVCKSDDTDDSQTICHRQSTQHKYITKRNRRPAHHRRDFMKCHQSDHTEEYRHCLSSSFSDVNSSAYLPFNVKSVRKHPQPADTLDEDGTGTRIHKSVYPHDAERSRCPNVTADNGRHHTRPTPHAVGDHRHRNKVRDHHKHPVSMSRDSRWISPNANMTGHHSTSYSALWSEVWLQVQRNMRKLARDHPEETGRLSFQQLLRANSKVLDSLQCRTPWDADSLNRAFRDAVYRGYLQVHQPDISLRVPVP